MSKVRSIKIKIESEWLESGYFVYAVEIKYKGKKYLYIGQTGDNNYHTARAPFYRISGHFADGASTENQVVKYLKSKILQNQDIDKANLEKALLKTEINYNFWVIENFDYADKAGHERGRKMSQMVEQWLIFHLQDNKRITVLNERAVNEITVAKRKFLGKEIDNLISIGKQILIELGYE